MVEDEVCVCVCVWEMNGKYKRVKNDWLVLLIGTYP